MQFTTYTTPSTDDVLQRLETSRHGLSPAQAQERLKKYGPNVVAAHALRWWHILARQCKSPFLYLLIGAAALALFLGEKSDGIIIIAFIVINTLLGFFEEFHSEKSLQLLKKYVVPEARALRGGKQVFVPTPDLVPGDIVLLEAGDVVPADVRWLETTQLTLDEGVLTGESVPVSKTAAPRANPVTAAHEASNIGFSGTTVVSGSGVGVGVATGDLTALGDISKLTVETHHQSGFEKGIAKFSSFILKMILVILILLFFVNLFIKGADAHIFELLLFSVALAVSVVPEALPVVTTIALSKGAVKLAEHKVVVKRLSAVEDLGSIEVLCSDKTGTLTENTLTVAEVRAADPRLCLRLAALASADVLDAKRRVNNSFDLALVGALTAEEKSGLTSVTKQGEIPFDPERRRNCVALTEQGVSFVVVRGAVESVLPLCRKANQPEAEEWMHAQGILGRRVIVVASKQNAGKELCSTDEHNLDFVGLISFEDPVKATATHAIAEAKKLGVSLKILTGDSAGVAGAVALKVRLVEDPTEVIEGDAFEKMSPAERAVAVDRFSVFARVSPRQKFMVIQELQKKYEVGFLGEGINDAPALKIADVGIVVAGASDIAREAADIVLLKRSLTVIVDGVREGREIFANTVKYIKATLISNFGNFYAIAVASLLIPYLPMLPVQILLLNLLSDFPMIAIATDRVDKEELRRPRSYNVREVVLMAVFLGLVSTVFDFIFFASFRSFAPSVLQTNWFIGSVLTELVLIFSIRTRLPFWKGQRPGSTLFLLSVVAFASAIVLPLTSLGSKYFSFARPTNMQVGQILVIVALYFAITETIKVLYYRHQERVESTV